MSHQVLCVGFLAISVLTAQSRLPVIEGDYPRAFFFRSSEGMAANPAVSFDLWNKTFSRLMGIEGKVLDEEVPGRSARNIEFFTRFKKLHPDQMVLLNFNGNARDPRFQASQFFAGHWLYYNGAKILSDVPAAAGETDIQVEDPRLFRTNTGRYRNANEDIGLCELDANGRPDWSRSEQVRLLSVDVAHKSIRVARAQYGSKPRAFRAGGAYAAAHVSEGPWGTKSNLLWHYNYSTAAPRDAQGRTCGEILAEDLARRFRPGGELAAFDGVEFDVLMHRPPQTRQGRGPDTDADGKPDGGIVGGVNRYGIGVVEFCRKLRAALPDKLILADGMGVNNQRAFGILNGIESEGFPHLRDLEMNDWPGGLNRHLFWAREGRSPVLNYINHKFNEPDPATKLPKTPRLPFSTHRLVFAAAMFTDAAICYSLQPEAEPGERVGVWDELRMGTEWRTGWLGRPLGPMVRLAEKQPELLRGRRPEQLRAEAGETRFRLSGVSVTGPDLYLSITASADPMKAYPPEIARMMTVRAGEESFMSWLNAKEFTAGFAFSQLRPGKVDIEITVEGPEPVRISRVAAYAHPDAIYREFTRGLVIANPSPRPYTFPLSELLPGKKYRRLRGSPSQDPKTNNGQAVESSVTLGPKDALFLVLQR